METPPSPSYVIIAYDATKVRSEHEFRMALKNVQMGGDILHGGDTILVLGVLQKVQHPMGYQLMATPDVSSFRAMEEEVSKKIDTFLSMLIGCAEKCEDGGVTLEVKITAGNPLKHVIIQEAVTSNATCVILDRHLRRELRFLDKQIPCKLALIHDNLSVEVLRQEIMVENNSKEFKTFFSMSKSVKSVASQLGEGTEQPAIYSRENPSTYIAEGSDMLKANFTSSDFEASYKQDVKGMLTKEGNEIVSICQGTQKRIVISQARALEAPILCARCGTRTELYIKDALKFSFAEIQLATNNFSKENLLGEGGYGHVYRGQLKDRQGIAAKVRKEASAQGFKEFNSELHVLSFARHKNIVMLLGYCCKENLNVLVYEYICNKSLEWHLYDSTPLEWHRRYAIAIGTAKGLRFLHEECRGGPIIHRDVRPNTTQEIWTDKWIHVFSYDNQRTDGSCLTGWTQLGDFGLAKWKTSDDPEQTRILGTLGYLAPEYAENGTVSIRTDVYAFGVVLLQLISGRKVVESKRDDQQQFLRQWAEPFLEKMELHEIIDPRIGDSHDTYELYLMARAARLCVKRNPELRPSMGEIVRILDGKRDRFGDY